MPASSSWTRWRDPGLALLLACALILGWTVRDWADLSRLRLPDTDDAMRLQQIRDWLGGQAFGDLAQHRLGRPPGLEMHWSRLPDLVPGALLFLLTPLAGARFAELAAVIAWPGLLFVAALALTGAIARRLGAPSATAIVVAALAYPASSLFLPGRIDHHGFQLVLILCLVRALVGTGTLGGGVAAGLATVASLAIGLETAPLLAIGGGAAVALWIARRPGAQALLLGYGAALTLALAAARVLLGTSGWDYPGCDGFTALLWRAAQATALAPLALGIAGFALESGRGRALAALAAALVAVAAVLLLAPDCLRPYGQVDPLLARLWLARVAEAQPLFAAPAANAVAYAGLASAGLVAGLWIVLRERTPGWAVLLGFQAAALAVTLFQLRGAYAGALLAAPALATLIAAARARGSLPLAGAWILSTGILYPIAGSAFFPSRPGSAEACTGPESLDRIAALPPGRLLGPVDLGAYAIAGTRHSVIAAPYHRNNQGNRAMYDFFLGDPARSEAIARQWGVDYVAFCPGELDGTAGPASLAAALGAGRAPGWLAPLSLPGEAPRVYRLVSRH